MKGTATPFDGSQDITIPTTIDNMTGASATAAGKAGLVPAPGLGQQDYFLQGNGVWSGALPSYPLQSGVDLNTLVTDGVYECYAPVTNGPSGSNTDCHFQVIVLAHTNIWVRQEAFDVRSNRTFTRALLNGTWTAWAEVPTSSIRPDLIMKTALSYAPPGYENVFGSGILPAVSANDLCYDSGHYQLSDQCTNLPFVGWWHLLVFTHIISQWCVQLAFNMNANRVFSRNLLGAAGWTEWIELGPLWG